MKRLVLCLVLLSAMSASAQSSGLVIWADASNETTDTGDEVCTVEDQQPQAFLVERECISVFVPGSATEVACDTDMTGSGTVSDYYLVLCR